MKKNLANLTVFSVISALLTSASCSKSKSSDSPNVPAQKTILGLAAETADLSTLAKLVTLCNLTDLLNNPSANFTVFAPSNAAFAAAFPTLPATCTDVVKTTLQNHVIDSRIKSDSISATQTEVKAAFGSVFAEKDSTGVTINNASKVVTADVSGSNGVVHIIDKVLTPDTLGTVVDIAAKRDTFSTLVAAVKLCDLATSLSASSPALTVFAPTDAAFKVYLAGAAVPATCDDNLKNILKYHVLGEKVASSSIVATTEPSTLFTGNKLYFTLSNSKIFVNGSSQVVAADVEGSNGTVHVIDTVLVPDSLGNIVSIAAKRPSLSTLVSLVKLCKLEDTLVSQATEYTLFAPTNAAFVTYLAGAAAPSTCTDDLKNTLLYHVLASKVKSTDLAAQQAVETKYTNNEVYVVKATGVTVNGDADVTTADLLGTKGVVHVVDAVLVPDDAGTVVDALAKRYDYSTLVSKLGTAGLVATLEGPGGPSGPFTVFAPKNSAFTGIPLPSTNETLAELLKFHVLSQNPAISSSAITATPTTLSTLAANTSTLTAVLSGGNALIYKTLRGTTEAPKVVEADIITSNGIVHGIDKVLLP